MHQGTATFDVKQRAPPEPADQPAMIRSFQDPVERVGRRRRLNTVSAAEELEVMVAKYGGDPGVLINGPPEHLQRARTTIDQIANQPEPVAPRFELETLQQPLQREETAVDVADDVKGHKVSGQ